MRTWAVTALLLLGGGGLLAIASTGLPAGHPPLHDPTGVAGITSRVPDRGGSPASTAASASAGTTAVPAPFRSSTSSLRTPSCTGSYTPSSLAYAASDKAFWVAASPCVEVRLASSTYTVSASYTVGTNPFGVAVDNATGNVFVTNTGSANVSVFSSVTGSPLGSVGVGLNPYGVAYDPASKDIYVANGGSDNVSVLSGSTLQVVASIPVGHQPVGVAADPITGDVYVANSGSDNVSIIHGSTNALLGSVGVGSRPNGIAFDGSNHRMYVTNEGSSNISVLDATRQSVQATIPVVGWSIDLQGIAYASESRRMWVAAGFATVAVINTTSERVASYIASDPSGVAYDPSDQIVCFTNSGNATFECLNVTLYWGVGSAAIAFNESGLPAGMAWTVGVNGANQTTTSTTAYFDVYPSWGWPWGTYGFSVTPPVGFTASPSSGNVTSGTNVTITFAAAADTYPLSFTESGLPAGTHWSVSLGGIGEAADVASIPFQRPNGSYPFSVASVLGYSSSPSAGSVVVAGYSVNVSVQFVAGPAPNNYSVTFLASGLANGTSWTVVVNGIAFVTQSDSIRVTLPPGTYFYSVDPVVGYVVHAPGRSFVLSNASLTLGVQFEAVYSIQFVEAGLPANTSWSVVFDAQVGSSRAVSIVFGVPGGPHDFTVAPVLGFSALPARGSLSVSADRTVVIVFTPASNPVPASLYLVTFEESGLAPGTSWGVSINGSQLVATGPTVGIRLPNGSFAFSVAPVAGYVSTPGSGTLAVTGGPVIATLVFTATPTTQGATPSGPLGASPLVVYAATATGLLIGALVGIAGAFVLRRPPRGPPPPA